MKMTIRTVLLAIILLGGGRMGQAQMDRIEKHGWGLVIVTHNDRDFTPTPKDSRFYGLPSEAYFAKDYPFEAGRESPKILVAILEYAELRSSLAPSQRGIFLLEFDCGRRLVRHLKTFKADGSEMTPETSESQRWGDIPKGTPIEALLKYACRPRGEGK